MFLKLVLPPRLGTALVLLLLQICCAVAGTKEYKKPHVIVLLLDDIGWADVGELAPRRSQYW